jgi:hypothetical protein
MSQAPVQSGLTPIAFMDSNGMVHATRHFFERRDQQPYPTVLPG